MYSTEQIAALLRAGRVHDFYNSRSWRKLARQILQEQHHECQWCRAKGKYRRAVVVHHVLHLKEYPELAYARVYKDDGGKTQRQLLALCRECHEAEHGRGFATERKGFYSVEKW